MNKAQKLKKIVREVSQMRRDIGVKYKDLTPAELREVYHQQNILDYKDPLGPSVDYLRDVKGKSWKEIVESACRVGGRNLPGT